MPVELISEDELRAALRRHRPNAETFEAAVRERLAALEKQREDDPLAGLPPLARSAAALLPIQLLSAGKLPVAAAKLLPASGIYKLLGYVVLPAVSLFVLLGAALMGAVRIRRTTAGSEPAATDAKAMMDWWNAHRRGFWLVFAVTMAMRWIGATWILFCLYIASMLVLVYLLSALAKVGLGNRWMVGQSCLMSLLLLGQCFAGTGDHDIHFVDQSVIGAVFMAGALLLGLCLTASGAVPRPAKWVPGWLQFAVMAVFGAPLMVYYLNPILYPTTEARIENYVESNQKTLSQRYYWQKWEQVADWTIERGLAPDLSVARRALADELHARPDHPWPDAVVLSYASLLGLVDRQMLDEPRWAEVYEHFRQDLFSLRDSQKRLEETRARAAATHERIARERAARQAQREKQDAELAARDPELAARHTKRRAELEAQHAQRRAEVERAFDEARPRPAVVQAPGADLPAAERPISDVNGAYWVLWAAALRGELTEEDRDFLESRLHVTIEQALSGETNDIDNLVWATRSLAAIGRPVDLERYRQRVQRYLLGRFCVPSGIFQKAGGFGKYVSAATRGPEPRSRSERVVRWLERWVFPPGRPLDSLEGTAAAVELMQTYGVPSEIDLNWVRSYLKPGINDLFTGDRWLQAVTRDRVDRLSGATPPSWLDYLYYERSLLAAIVLVGLCLYATLASPKAKEPAAAAPAGG